MDITAFTEDIQADNEYAYKVLVYPNITFQKNLERDSYVVVIREALRRMTALRPDVHWTLIVPEIVNSLSKLPNVDQKILSMPSYPNLMRTHFNANEFLRLVDWKNQDFDIVYSHLPEHTAQIANVFANSTHLTPKIVGYCHWFEVPENTAYAKTMLWSNLAGLLEMEECGVNSEWLKEFILTEFAWMVTPNILAKLDNIIQPHYLGIDGHDLKYVPNLGHKHIIFNHRANDYTGWSWFAKMMDEIWETRQDFTVHTTLAQSDRPWNKSQNLTFREEYLAFLQQMDFGVGCFEKYSAWSISTTDGLSQGTPYLLPHNLCYPEMVGKDYPLLYSNRADFKKQFVELLDGEGALNSAVVSLKSTVPPMMWDTRVDSWFGNTETPWSSVFDLNKCSLKSKTEGYQKVLGIIEDAGSITKKDLLKKLGWGVSISWSPYRNMLRNESHIRFTKDKYEVRTGK